MFWPVLYEGKVVVPGDIPFSNVFWRDAAPSDFSAPQNDLLGDQISQFYVWHYLAAESMQRNARIPLWNPYIFTGQPLVANAQSALLYPPNLLLFWLTPGRVATVRNVFNLLTAATFTFLFCRTLGVSRKGSTLSALAFGFSGPLIVWLGHPHANALVWLPAMMWAGENLQRQRSPFPWIGAIGLGFGMSILGGHPETSFHVGAVFLAYFVARLCCVDASLRRRAGLLAALAVALVLGLIIGGIQLLPFAGFLFDSSTLAHGGRSMGGTNWFYSDEWLPNVATLVTTLYPNFFGNPTSQTYRWPFATYENYNEQSAYLGVIPLALAAGAVLASRRKRQNAVLAALALLCIAVALRLPGFELINHLPGFSMSLNSRLRMPTVFLVAVLAGLGYDQLREQIASRKKLGRSSVHAGGAILCAIVAILLIITFLKYIGPLFLEITTDSFLHHLLFGVFSLRQPKTFTPVAVALALCLGYIILRRWKSRRFGFENLLIALALAELLVLAWGYNPMVEESEILPSVRAVEILKQEEPFRIVTTDGVFWPNYPAVYGISDVAGYDLPVYLRYSDLYVAQGGQVDYRQKWDANWPLVDYLNVKYVVTPQELADSRFNPVFSSEGYRIYENEHALPRAFMVYDVDIMEDEAAILDYMLGGQWDPRATAFLEEPLPLAEMDSLHGKGGFSVDFVQSASDTVVLDVASSRPGLLVMSDQYTRDWVVQVDAEPVKLHRTNYAYRGVFVPEGQHRITFAYVPKPFFIGVGLTALGSVVAILLLAFGHARRTRSNRNGANTAAEGA